jgi:hypothetical protein
MSLKKDRRVPDRFPPNGGAGQGLVAQNEG